MDFSRDYNGKSILIVGGGTSTLDRNWDKEDKPFIYYEPEHYRHEKQKSSDFIAFQAYIKTPIVAMTIDLGEIKFNPAQKSGATFRMILLAMQATKARKVNFVGFDGFNKEFSNAHVNIFVDPYTVLASLEDNNRLRNLGEGLDYNLGTELSKKYFPLSKDIYETIR